MMLVLLLHKDHLSSLEVIDMILASSVWHVSLHIMHRGKVIVNLTWVLELFIVCPLVNLIHSTRLIGLSLLYVRVIVIEFVIVSISIGICN